MYYKCKSYRVSAERWFPNDFEQTIRLGISVYTAPWGSDIFASICGGTPINPGDWVTVDDRGRKRVVTPEDFEEEYEAVGGTLCRCRLIEYTDEGAVCSARLPDVEIPRMSASPQAANVLRGKGIKPGDYFNWNMTNVQAYPEDIDPAVEQEPQLSREEKDELDRLFEESKNRNWDDWNKTYEKDS